MDRIDLVPVMARDAVDKERLQIQCARIDESSNRWYVGTSHGLAVGDLDHQSHKPSALLRRVRSLDTTSPVMIGSFLGRLMLAVDHDGTGSEGTILLERGFGVGPEDANGFANERRFTSIKGTDEMGRASAAAMVGPDVIWVKGFGGVWEWTPGGWLHMDADFELPRQGETRIRPVVVSSLLRDKAWCIRPRSSSNYRETSEARAPLHVVASDVCPDPSGGGIWFWDQKSSPPDMDYVRFATPHGVTDNKNGTRHPANFRVARVIHRDAGGFTHTPLARNRALLLPTGSDFLLCRAGHWAETDWEADPGVTFTDLTPGARSVDAAWLAIRRNQDKTQHLVTLDVDPQSSVRERAKMVIVELALTAPAGSEVALVPDSKGSVWFAVQKIDGWEMRRIDPGLVGRGPTLFAPRLPEPPRFLFLPDMTTWLGDGFLLTDTGGSLIVRASRIGEAPTEPTLLAPEVKPWSRLWEQAHAPGSPVEYEVFVVKGWGMVAGDQRAIVVRRPSAEADFATFIVSPTAEAVGLRLEPAGRRLESGTLRGFIPRLWFPGLKEYVIGEQAEDPEKKPKILVIPIDGVGSIHSPSWLRVLGGDTGSILGARLSGVAINRVDDQGAEVIATAAGKSILFEEVSSLYNPPLFVPTRLDLQEGTTRRSNDTRQSPPPSPLPSSVDLAVVEVAPDYGDWWRPDWSRIRLRDDGPSEPGARFSVNPTNGSFQVPMAPGVQRFLVPSNDGWPSTIAFDLNGLALRVLPSPAGVNTWLLLGLFPLAVGIVVAGIATSQEFYHRFVAPFGFGWVFSEAEASDSVIIRSDGRSRAVVTRSGYSDGYPVGVPPDQAEFQGLREHWHSRAVAEKSDPYLVRANIGGDIFKFDWNKCFSDPWTDPAGLVFSGQIFVKDRADSITSRTARRGPMVVTGLGCALRPKDGDIPMMSELVNRMVSAFQSAGFRVRRKNRGATCDDLSAAFRDSDILIILGHALGGAIRLPTGDFGAAEWRALGKDIRCRFVLFLGCGLGDLAGPGDPLLREIVSQGVTCIASSHEQQEVLIAKALLPAFCEDWTKGKGRGCTVAEAMRSASSKVGYRNDENLRNEQINSYTIIGTPTLRLEWRFLWRLWQ